MYLNDPRHWSQVSNQVLWCVQSFCIKGTGLSGWKTWASQFVTVFVVETWSTSRAKFFASFLSEKACSIMASSGSPCGAAHLRNWRVCGWPSGGLTESNWSFMCLILDWHCQFVFNLIHVDNKRACHSVKHARTVSLILLHSFKNSLFRSLLASSIVSFLPIGLFVQFQFTQSASLPVCFGVCRNYA